MAWGTWHLQLYLINQLLCSDEEIKAQIIAVIRLVTQAEPRSLGTYSSAFYFIAFSN